MTSLEGMLVSVESQLFAARDAGWLFGIFGGSFSTGVWKVSLGP